MEKRDEMFVAARHRLAQVESLEGVEENGAGMEFYQTRDGDLRVMLRAMLVHRTGRGPVRVGGGGSTFDEALHEIANRIHVENEKAAKRAARGK